MTEVGEIQGDRQNEKGERGNASLLLTLTMSAPPIPTPASEILYRPYIDEETDLGHIVRLVESELSEPYTVS